jgi:hypothetical protein
VRRALRLLLRHATLIAPLDEGAKMQLVQV